MMYLVTNVSSGIRKVVGVQIQISAEGRLKAHCKYTRTRDAADTSWHSWTVPNVSAGNVPYLSRKSRKQAYTTEST